jgi:small subunit ribosomal protein S9
MSDQVYSTGRRKESIAKVWLSSGSGNIIINKKKN